MNLDEYDCSEAETDGDEDSLWENPDVQHLSKYPDPFKGYSAGQDIFDFIEKVERAFFYNRVPASNRVVVLQKLVKGYAKSSFSDYASYDKNVERLKDVFGNPFIIWRNKLDEFLRRSRQEAGNWTDDFSSEREQMLWKVSGFLATAESLTTKFESLQGEVFHPTTLGNILSVLPPRLSDKIIEKVATTEIASGTFNTFRQTFKNIQEVLKEEAKLEAVASRYSDAIAENRKIYGQARKDEKVGAVPNSSKSGQESSATKSVKESEVKNPKKLALRNLKRHSQRISRSIRAEKNAHKMIENFLKKSRQVMVKFNNILSNKEKSRIQKKMDEVKDIVNSKKVKDKRKFMLDDYIETEEDLRLKEFPSESLKPAPAQAKIANLDSKANSLDEDIENRLTKLRFFNQTWLKDVSNAKPMMSDRKDHEDSNAVHETVEENDDKVPAVGIINEEPTAEHLDAIQVATEPVISSQEDTDAFNDWYLQKISESKIPRKSKSRFSSLSSFITEAMSPTVNEQVLTMTDPNQPMWKVDMNVIIVVVIALLSYLPGILRTKVPITASPTVTPTSSSVCKTCICAVSGMKSDQSLTALIRSKGFCGSNKKFGWAQCDTELKGPYQARCKLTS